MRDDIHSRIPLAPGYRALLRRCVAPAYQQNAGALAPFASKAVHRLIASNCSSGLIGQLRAEVTSPTLFGLGGISFPCASVLQSDIMKALRFGGNSIEGAVSAAARGQIDSDCREVVASLRAAGATRREALTVGETMSMALKAQVDSVSHGFVHGLPFEAPKTLLSVNTPLTLGRSARSGH